MFTNETVTVVGLGKEGIAALRFLRSRYPSVSLVAADRAGQAELGPAAAEFLAKEKGIRLSLGPDYLSAVADTDVVVRSPGVSLRISELEDAATHGVRITSGTNIFLAHTRGRVLGVTGTKGKSTTSSLLAHLLRSSKITTRLIGNIGVPALDALTDDDDEVTYVYELSSYQLEDIEGRLELAVLLNLYPEHLDYHGSLESYFQAKLRILTALAPGAPLVYGSYAPHLLERLHGFKGPAHPAPGSRVTIAQDALLIDGTRLVKRSQVKLLGEHNFRNAACAVEAALLAGASAEAIGKGLKKFEPLEHRLEIVGTFHGMQWINDAIATTPEATIAALRAVPDPVQVLITGGLDRGYDFTRLAEEIVALGVAVIIPLPGSGATIAEKVRALTEDSAQPIITAADSMEQAVRTALFHAQSDTTCLLSCASPSYNLFRNFEDRGRQFKHWVRTLA